MGQGPTYGFLQGEPEIQLHKQQWSAGIRPANLPRTQPQASKSHCPGARSPYATLQAPHTAIRTRPQSKKPCGFRPLSVVRKAPGAGRKANSPGAGFERPRAKPRALRRCGLQAGERAKKTQSWDLARHARVSRPCAQAETRRRRPNTGCTYFFLGEWRSSRDGQVAARVGRNPRSG